MSHFKMYINNFSTKWKKETVFAPRIHVEVSFPKLITHQWEIHSSLVTRHSEYFELLSFPEKRISEAKNIKQQWGMHRGPRRVTVLDGFDYIILCGAFEYFDFQFPLCAKKSETIASDRCIEVRGECWMVFTIAFEEKVRNNCVREMRRGPRRVAVLDGPQAWPPLAPSKP